MRIHFALTTVCLSLGLASTAQSSGIGIKAGIQASSAKAILIRTGPIPGGTAGLYFPWGIAPMMELQPELLISSLGTAWMEQDGDQVIERSLYIQVPLTVKYFLSNGFNLAGGYQFGKPVAATVTGTEGNSSTLDRYENMDHGFVGGVGMDFQHGVDVSMRAYSAMTRFHGDDDALFAKNRSIQLTVGYRVHQFNRSGSRRR
ncbi:MAG TPA: outer membrane beta-barrel protein [Flavobacteriales bacterium]|nr:outer membrane beta-barrel protein [Flavobacteriales bacterium]